MPRSGDAVEVLCTEGLLELVEFAYRDGKKCVGGWGKPCAFAVGITRLSMALTVNPKAWDKLKRADWME